MEFLAVFCGKRVHTIRKLDFLPSPLLDENAGAFCLMIQILSELHLLYIKGLFSETFNKSALMDHCCHMLRPLEISSPDPDRLRQMSLQLTLASLDLQGYLTPSVVTTYSMDTVHRCSLHAFTLMHLNTSYSKSIQRRATLHNKNRSCSLTSGTAPCCFASRGWYLHMRLHHFQFITLQASKMWSRQRRELL